MNTHLTVWQLRELNGDFGLACQIGGDKLKITEVKNLTNVELLTLKARLQNERLLERVNNEMKKRKLFR